jgi:hypothetical protein
MNRIAGIISRIRGSRKEDALLSLAALLLFLIALGYTIFAVRSLAKRTAAAFGRSEPPATAEIKFEIEKLEPLIEAGKLERR